jgi:GTP1/Obg family GTP-binding protein
MEQMHLLEQCDKYKKSFSSLSCFQGAKHFITKLKRDNIENLKTSNLNQVNVIIQNYMSSL